MPARAPPARALGAASGPAVPGRIRLPGDGSAADARPEGLRASACARACMMSPRHPPFPPSQHARAHAREHTQTRAHANARARGGGGWGWGGGGGGGGGVAQIARVTRLEPGVPLYRGLGWDADLPALFAEADAHGCSGFTEWGFMSTTSRKQVAAAAGGRAALVRLRGEIRVFGGFVTPPPLPLPLETVAGGGEGKLWVRARARGSHVRERSPPHSRPTPPPSSPPPLPPYASLPSLSRSVLPWPPAGAHPPNPPIR